MKFVRAEIHRRAIGRGESNEITVADPETLRELLAFFPHVGEGRQSYSAGHWLPGAQVQFFRADGSSVMVSVDLDAESPAWHDATGEWPLKKGFSEFLNEVEKGGQGQQGASK